MRRVAVKIAYLGNEFAGSQIQPNERTVEGEVLSNLTALGNLNEKEIDLKCASRTDKGVNALGNTAVFNTMFDDNTVLLKALNAVSRGVYYRSAAEVDDSFNPRHADERIYRYVLSSDHIDIEKAKECASLFAGEHDFARFCKADGKDTVMTMRSVSLIRGDDVIIIEFRSSHFLWNQIRRIVAAISAVAKGDADIADVKRALDGRSVSFGMARADALTLIDVVYKGIDFKSPAEDMFASRIDEEMFAWTLRRAFFASL